MRAALILCLAMLVSAVPAAAQEGLHVDPESPAGKEYALPLDSARREAQGKGAAGKTSGKAPLFGEGIRAAGGRGPARGGDRATPADRTRAAARARGKGGRRGPAEATIPTAGSDGSATLTSVGIALAALLAAGGLGLLLRRVLR